MQWSIKGTGCREVVPSFIVFQAEPAAVMTSMKTGSDRFHACSVAIILLTGPSTDLPGGRTFLVS